MIERWSAGIADQNMAEDILLDLGPIVRRHPWWQARARLTLRLLGDLQIKPPAQVLDAGCGWGVTLDALEKAGYAATGLDQSRSALEQLDRPGRAVDRGRPESSDSRSEHPQFDAVLALDVIEHLDFDAARREAARNTLASRRSLDRHRAGTAGALRRVRRDPGTSPTLSSRRPAPSV